MKAKNTLLKKIILLVIIFFSAVKIFAKDQSPKNVVALSKSCAQMWILSGGKISGTTDDALELEEAKNAELVGTLTTASLEAIIALNPQLILLTLDIPVHKTLNANLKSLGYKTYVVDVKNFSDYEKVMKDFTDLTGRRDLHKKNVDDVKEEIQKIISSSKTNFEKTYYFIRVSSAKNKVLKDHFGNEIFENLGLKSIVQDSNLLDEYSVEQLLVQNPDYIFVVTQGNEKKAMESFKTSYESNPVWKELKAVKENHVVILPKNLFNYKPNDKWDEAYKLAYEEIYGNKQF